MKGGGGGGGNADGGDIPCGDVVGEANTSWQ